MGERRTHGKDCGLCGGAGKRRAIRLGEGMITLAKVRNHYLLTDPPIELYRELFEAGWKRAGIFNRQFITDSQTLAEQEGERLQVPIVIVFGEPE